MNTDKETTEEESAFIESLCHSLLSTMISIESRATNAEHNISSPERVANDLKRISASARRLRRITESARNLCRLQMGRTPIIRLETLSWRQVHKMVVESLRDCSLLTGTIRPITFEVSVEGQDLESARCKSDVHLLEQILAAIIDNAFKFSTSGGVVEARLSLAPPCIRIVIENKGVVLLAEDLPHVTERGWRSREAQLCSAEGSGIGLWLASSIASAIGVSMAINPTTPAGITTVEISIPTTPTK